MSAISAIPLYSVFKELHFSPRLRPQNGAISVEAGRAISMPTFLSAANGSWLMARTQELGAG
jgi:hypothetical protein